MLSLIKPLPEGRETPSCALLRQRRFPLRSATWRDCIWKTLFSKCLWAGSCIWISASLSSFWKEKAARSKWANAKTLFCCVGTGTEQSPKHTRAEGEATRADGNTRLTLHTPHLAEPRTLPISATKTARVRALISHCCCRFALFQSILLDREKTRFCKGFSLRFAVCQKRPVGS